MGFFDRSKKVKKANSALLAQPSSPPTSPQETAPPTPPRPIPQAQTQSPTHASPISPPQSPPRYPQHWQHEPQQQGVQQPAGYLPAPPGWAPQPPSPPYDYRAPIVVNQNYYISNVQGDARPTYLPLVATDALHKFNRSMVNLAKDVPGSVLPQLFDDGLPAWHGPGSQLLNQSAALYDQVFSKFNNLMTLIDLERYTGKENDLMVVQPPPEMQAQAAAPLSPPQSSAPLPKGGVGKESKKKGKDAPKGQTTAVAASVVPWSYIARVDQYGNAKLPKDLPPLRLYINSWPLVSLAARYAERVYESPSGAERDLHVNSDWKTGTKAMVIKSIPMDRMNTIVFAIRGTATFMDWAVNLNMAPTSPAGFLDDPGNFCHAGFLSVAKKMIKPVAARLRQLIEEDPNRSSYSLLITGHSAGGAVASLIYSHMLSTSKQTETELNLLTGCFKRVHCITFGTPPVSLLPLTKPKRPELDKSMFISFVNEGDPVARADKAYVRSLLDCYTAPVPAATKTKPKEPSRKSASTTSLVSSSRSPRKSKSKVSISSRDSKSSSSSRRSKPTWKVPPSTLSNAGRIVVLRSGDARAKNAGRSLEQRLNDGVVAHVADDEQLRGVIWGDPLCHVMKFYAARIETLAVGAVTARGY